jgi:hypothetical protein
MLQSIKQLYERKLGASDGEIGRVKDFYFDDQKWAVRYLVADTGTWLTGRQVLLSPRAFARFDQAEKVFLVNLTRKQIENCPSIEEHKPVSRQYEEEYHRYYCWPYYWEGEGLLGGMSSPPFLMEPARPLPSKPIPASGPPPTRADTHLRSTQAVKGYHIEASDGTVGHVCDFMMDNQNWAIAQLVVKTGHRFSGQEVLIPVTKIDRISYEQSTVFVNLTKAAVEQSSIYNMSPSGAVA